MMTLHEDDIEERFAEECQLLDDHYDSVLHQDDSDESDEVDDDPRDANHGFEDDYDIPLTPRAARKARTSRKRKPKRGTPSLPASRLIDNPRPISFPLEVLELFCQYLPQATLRCVTSLVCRAWKLASDRHIRRVGIWKAVNNDFQRAIVDKMHTLDTLECWHQVDPENHRLPFYPAINSLLWTDFTKEILQSFEPIPDERRDQTSIGQDFRDPIQSCLLHSIKELSIQGRYLLYNTHLQALIPGFRFLETLKVSILGRHMSIPLFTLLNSSPNLRHVQFESAHYINVSFTAGDKMDSIVELSQPVINPETAHFPVKPPEILPPVVYPEQYRLEVFEASFVSTKPRIFERLFSTCPNLKTFKGSSIQYHLYYPITEEENEQRLAKHAKRHCPKLKWYTHLIKPGPTDLVDFKHLNLLKEHFPDITQLSLYCDYSSQYHIIHYFSPEFLRQITTLEISPCTHTVQSGYLERFLNAMPKLCHLYALRIPYKVPPEPLIFPYYHWASWQLRTVELDLQHSDAYVRVFDYISRRCPKLESAVFKIYALHIGQRMHGPQTKKVLKYASPSASTTSTHPPGSRTIVNSMRTAIERVEPRRFDNSLLALKSLKWLETLKIYSNTQDGVILVSDFEFMRRVEDRPIIDPPASSDLASTTQGGENKTSSPTTDKAEETWCPKLQAFHYYYGGYATWWSADRLLPRIQEIRPGVEIRIQNRSFA
ncbi:hypothetical protein BGW38_005063 [Lunasporangiospora selenospora]|uniref:F-box domain-containing protein n=1 Tax=Lunasporangiospora selenospora TaxID=979761 RepID=A0A9P6FPA6_9FUNG|nr:hypothetical protein BGW38_005063 [Lunasporangiospora selenospora]